VKADTLSAGITPAMRVSFETSPDRYRHWKLEVDGAVAMLLMDVREDAALSGNYRLNYGLYGFCWFYLLVMLPFKLALSGSL